MEAGFLLLIGIAVFPLIIKAIVRLEQRADRKAARPRQVPA